MPKLRRHKGREHFSLVQYSFDNPGSDLINRLHQPNPTLDLPAPTAITAATELTRTLVNIPAANLLAVPTKRPHSPLPIQRIICISLR
jgi:hypothetical protein